MIAAFQIMAVFSGLALCLGVVATSIMIANGKLTLPGTSMRRIQQERVALAVVELRRERELAQMNLDAQIDVRMSRALSSGEGGDKQ